MKKWYFKLDSEGVILDAIEYPFEGYVAVELVETHLPAGINGGWYKWDGIRYYEVPELKAAIINATKEKRKAENADIIAEAIDAYTLELINRGVI